MTLIAQLSVNGAPILIGEPHQRTCGKDSRSAFAGTGSGPLPSKSRSFDLWRSPLTPLVDLKLMRPGTAPVIGEVIRIRDARALARWGLEHLIGDAMALAIGDRLVLGVEVELHLLLHVARRGPAHQRLDRARLFGLVVEHPFLGLGGPRLHRGAGRFVDAGGHGITVPNGRGSRI